MSSLKNKLLEMYAPTGEERVGFVLGNGKVVEVKNISADPERSFMIQTSDIEKYLIKQPKLKATWHTHPGKNSNLSVSDYVGFQNYPDVAHYIIGSDGIRKYVVEDGAVLQQND
jgi:proteasome lid subunit RPN8/RPN11